MQHVTLAVQDRRAIRQAEAEVERATTSEHGKVFHNDIIAQGELPDAKEGGSTGRDRWSGKKNQTRYSWNRSPQKDDKGRQV